MKLTIAGLATIAVGIAFAVYAGLVYSEINHAVSVQRSLKCNAPSGTPCPTGIDSNHAVPYSPDGKLEIGIALVMVGAAAATASYWLKSFISFMRYLSIPRRLLIAGMMVVSVHVSVFVLGPYVTYCRTGFYDSIPCTPLDAVVATLYYLMPVLWYNTVWIGPAMVTMAIVRGCRPVIHGRVQ